MSAKRLQMVFVAITVAHAMMAVFIAGSIPAAAADLSAAQPPVAQRLTRDDVDLLLRQARSAIQQGNLDQADALVQRAENAHVHYSLLHLGSTPSSVRRELNRARRGQPAGASVQGARAGQVLAPGNNPGSLVTTDPFLTRNPLAGQAQSLPAAARTQPVPHSMPSREFGDIAQASAQMPQHLPELGQDMSIPFLQSRPNAPRPARYDAPSTAGYPVANAGWDNDTGGSVVTDSSAALSSTGSIAENPAWALPDAPLPRGMNYAPDANDRSLPGMSPQQPKTAPPSNSGSAEGASTKQQVLAQLNAARAALDSGDVDLAENLARAASATGIPESQFLPDEDRPSLLAWDIERARQSQNRPQTAAARLPATAPRYATQLGQPISENAPALSPAQGELPASGGGERWAALPEPLSLPAESAAARAPQSLSSDPTRGRAPATDATALLDAGESALERHDRKSALELFAQAHSVRQQLEPADRERLQDRLQMLAAEPVDTTISPAATAPTSQADEQLAPAAIATDADPMQPTDLATPPSSPSTLIEATDENEQLLARQLSAEVGKRQSESQRLREEDPERAVAILREAQQMVNESKLSETSRRELLSRIEITLNKAQSYIDDHKAEIDLDQQNEAVLNEVDRRREVKLKVQQKTAELVDEFNRLQNEQRYAEAEIIAKRLYEMSPDDPVSRQVQLQAKFLRREMINRDLIDLKDESAWEQLNATEQSAINPVAKDGQEHHFDQRYWDQFVKNRQGSRERTERRTPRELEIERRLQTPVLLRYQETPLTEVIQGMSELTGVNIHLDPRGLEQEGYTADTKVTVNLNKEVSLKSALNLILEPLHLSYVIKDEVLMITSESLRDGEIYPVTYNVADLVIPIPNFVPNNNIGLQGLINDAHAAMGYGNGIGMPGPAVLVNERGQQKAAGNDQVLAQQFNAVPGAPANGVSPATVPIGSGPGGMGAGALADFDSLIDLIVSTVATETWAENGGGEAEIRPFPTNLDLVISQTQAVHEEIADLLEQLRRLQDLQVTIEVRFIRLNDRFFERIGIDFDVNIEDRTIGTADLIPGQPFEPGRQSATVGLQFPVTGVAPFPNFTNDLDIPFRQESFGLSIPPPFGGASQVASFGFAILSDIEAYFLIEAAQGDSRTNILNAPKVTLFNGQTAFVADAISQPFVIGVIPVVGEFVAAQQPVIVVLNEGTMMTIQAVVSDDRRYVRMTVVPFFTQVGDVQEFTFEGSSSSTSSSSSTDDDDDGKNESEEDSEEQVRSGVTVQLPAFQFVSVVTTVSVPDGGTVLLGGIKRLSEGRNEFGVPLLSKVPYVNRLFRNVGIGRDTDSLMMMVTPRIIIQEEEEERLGIPPAP